jgi:hypothetical protein
MRVEVEIIGVTFLAFTSFYNVSKVNNTLALTLDPRPKSLNAARNVC